MWHLDARSILRLQGSGGESFAKFVDALIRVHGFAHGVGEAGVLSTSRVNVEDGGADTRALQAIPGDSTGYFHSPTCWQYKAQPHRDITEPKLRRELRKRHATDLIASGHGYRLAICDDMPPEKQDRWRKTINDEIQKIAPGAPQALIVTASQLASWANRYPALIPAHFGSSIGPALHFEAWSRSATATTREYAAVAAWNMAIDSIREHIDLSRSTKEPLIALQGLAGVGKTRLAFEAVSALAGARNAVLYTNDGQDAEDVARRLVNDSNARGILVADECPSASQAKLRQVLKGHTDRIRAVCIDNAGDRHSGSPELWLETMTPADCDAVLAKNFPDVAAVRRHSYSMLAGGYIRLAADMCERDSEIEERGSIAKPHSFVDEYYRLRLPERDRQVVEAIALVRRVGFGEGVGEELEALCQFTGLPEQEVLDTAKRTKNSPGFIAVTTRYLYITPEIVAITAFQRAWKRWFEPNPAAALSGIPAVLLSSFLARVEHGATPEVRAQVGDFFRESVAGLTPADLAEPTHLERLIGLVHIDPDRFFPHAIRLLRDATPGDLRRISDRRLLVSTVVGFAAFPSRFEDAEVGLRRLALAETEEGISNNATGLWTRLFRVALSGTPVPFAERLELLEGLLGSNDLDQRNLALAALDAVFDFNAWRLAGEPVIAGQLVPPDWEPGSSSEFRECLERAVALLKRLLETEETPFADKIWRILGREARTLLTQGQLVSLRALTDSHSVSAERLPELLETIEEFLEFDCRSTANPYCAQVAAWRNSLIPTDFAGRLRAVIGKEPWRYDADRSKVGTPEIESLALEMARDSAKCGEALRLLSREDAPSAELLGRAVAGADAAGTLLDAVFTGVMEGGAGSFAAGYAAELVRARPEFAQRLNDWLDRLESGAPELAFRIAVAADRSRGLFPRVRRMVEGGRLSVLSFSAFRPASRFAQLSPEDVASAVRSLVSAGDRVSSRIALELVERASPRMHDSPEFADSAWRAVEASAPVEDHAAHHWSMALRTLSKLDVPRACRVAVSALVGADYAKRDEAWEVLGAIASSQPAIAMRGVGESLLNPAIEERLRFRPASHFFRNLASGTVEQWLDSVGLEGARAIAYHLEPPFKDNSGVPVAPALTEYVLAKWGGDETVFQRFETGVYNFQIRSGDLAAHYRAEAERAKLFLNHRVAAVRKWAESELQRSQAWGKMAELEAEEALVPR